MIFSLKKGNHQFTLYICSRGEKGAICFKRKVLYLSE